MKKTIFIFLLSFGILSCGNKSATYTPQYKPLTEAVYASGQVLPKYEYQVFSVGEGIILDRYINEGDMVTKDQPLFRIKNESVEARLNNANEIYRVAQTNLGMNSPVLSEMESALQSSRERMINDSVFYNRTKALWEQDAISKNEFDRSELTYKTSTNDYKARLQSYQKMKNQLYLELKNAQSQLTITQDDKNNYTVRSFISGMVYEVYKEPGEVTRRNEPIALIADAREVYIQLSVDEQDIEKVTIGQEVLVKMDIYKGKIFKAKVIKIYPRLQAMDQSFRVDALFTDSIPKLYSGITAEANIIIQKKEKALVIPKDYVIGEDSIWIKSGRKRQKIQIVKGAENYEWVEVLKGADEKTEILEP